MPGEREALACDVQRFSVHDGPGIRTTVFFKGCPLACQWCHNPEAVSYGNELVYSQTKCIRCGDCVPACPESAIELVRNGVDVDHRRCTDCLQCVEACPSSALSPAARSYTSESLLAEVLRDSDYFGSDGGITLSGGEPLIHVAFLKEFLPKAKASGLHIVAETAGYWPYEKLEPMLKLIDLFLFDVKVVDENRHRQLTGRSNKLILENLKRLVADGYNVRVRTPFVPGRNSDDGNLSKTADLLAGLGQSMIVLLPYHALGKEKLVKIGAPARPKDLREPSKEEIAAASTSFESRGIQVCRA